MWSDSWLHTAIDATSQAIQLMRASNRLTVSRELSRIREPQIVAESRRDALIRRQDAVLVGGRQVLHVLAQRYDLKHGGTGIRVVRQQQIQDPGTRGEA